MSTALSITSASTGDSSAFLTTAALEAALVRLHAPRDAGRVTLVVSRGTHGERLILHRTHLTPEAGVPGDSWGRGARSPRSQLAVIQDDVATLIANGQPLPLFGDNLYLDLDLSAPNLPPGSRVRVGEALLEVTTMPHLGCKKYAARFGPDALAFISHPNRRHLNLRGIYMCVIEGGSVGAEDQVRVVSRG